MHGQDRFFQMDLMRCYAAGEMAAAAGAADALHRPLPTCVQLRRVAERAFDALPDAHRRHLQIYSDGVNAGLAQLGDRLRNTSSSDRFEAVDAGGQPARPARGGRQPVRWFGRMEMNRSDVLRYGSPEIVEFLFPAVHPDDRPMMDEVRSRCRRFHRAAPPSMTASAGDRTTVRVVLEIQRLGDLRCTHRTRWGDAGQ